MFQLKPTVTTAIFVAVFAVSSVSAMPLQNPQKSASEVLRDDPDAGARGSNTYQEPGVRGGGNAARSNTPVYPWVWEQEAVMRREGAVTFLVRIENISPEDAMDYGDGTTEAAGMSHGVYAVFRGDSPMFVPGRPAPATNGFEALAEDGNVRPLQAYLADSSESLESGIFYKPVGAVRDEELWPGKVYEFTVTGDPGDKLTFATMLMQSNDLVYAPEAGYIDLFDADGRPISGDITGRVALLDAGTEINEEPGFAVCAGLSQTSLNEGPAESKPVAPVDDGYNYPSVDTVLRITVQPQ